MIEIGIEYITKHSSGTSFHYESGTLPCVPRVGENVWRDDSYYRVKGVYYAPALDNGQWEVEIKCERVL